MRMGRNEAPYFTSPSVRSSLEVLFSRGAPGVRPTPDTSRPPTIGQAVHMQAQVAGQPLIALPTPNGGSVLPINQPTRPAIPQGPPPHISGPPTVQTARQIAPPASHLPQQGPSATPLHPTQPSAIIRTAPASTSRPITNGSVSPTAGTEPHRTVQPPPNRSGSTYDPHPLNPLPLAAPRKFIFINLSSAQLAGTNGTATSAATAIASPPRPVVAPSPHGIAPKVMRAATVPSVFSSRITPSRPGSTSSRQNTPTTTEGFPQSVTTIAPRPSPNRPQWAATNRPIPQPQQLQTQQQTQQPPQQQQGHQQSQQQQQRPLLPAGSQSRPPRQSPTISERPATSVPSVGPPAASLAQSGNEIDELAAAPVPEAISIETLRKHKDALSKMLQMNTNRPANVRYALVSLHLFVVCSRGSAIL